MQFFTVSNFSEGGGGRGIVCHGPGIDPAFARQIFEPFHRGAASSKTDGIGIGLATVRKIIQKHSGEIWLDSPDGQGAVFSFTLPQHDFAHKEKPTLAP